MRFLLMGALPLLMFTLGCSPCKKEYQKCYADCEAYWYEDSQWKKGEDFVWDQGGQEYCASQCLPKNEHCKALHGSPM